MRFVRSHTKIPIPRVYSTFRWLSYHYIIMDRIPDVELDDVWEDMPLDGKIAVAAQLRDYFAQLRATPPPGSTAICSVTGGPFICSRLHAEMEWCGPFRDEEHMNSQLRRQKSPEKFDEVVQASHRLVHPLVFTHNDFAPRNVMVKETPLGWEVAGIIDWECAGWLPSHWEYCKSLNWNCLNANCGSWNWEGRIPKILEPFDLEAEADRKLLPPPTFHVL
ncbi:kinase-like protein [Armillaria solidipes]|uniref:Kinase-like protein n=1 Tax=Armillaria solidipes TaxID=1076256 RepID=A0A2H3C7S5_9AGAR|nr:kinase-like protein [Armillaria solidipes]